MSMDLEFVRVHTMISYRGIRLIIPPEGTVLHPGVTVRGRQLKIIASFVQPNTYSNILKVAKGDNTPSKAGPEEGARRVGADI